ncbi:hypothetical protein ACNKHM_07800 [Shigella sonnei]
MLPVTQHAQTDEVFALTVDRVAADWRHGADSAAGKLLPRLAVSLLYFQFYCRP